MDEDDLQTFSDNEAWEDAQYEMYEYWEEDDGAWDEDDEGAQPENIPDLGRN